MTETQGVITINIKLRRVVTFRKEGFKTGMKNMEGLTGHVLFDFEW